MTKRGTSHFRKAEDKRRMDKLKLENCYWIQLAHYWDRCYDKRSYRTKQRKTAKRSTNKVCRCCNGVPDYSGYRKLCDYWWDVW